MSPLTERSPENFGKKLIRRNDLEDALKRLDKLTHEEARIASAEVQRARRAIDEREWGAREQTLAISDRVATVEDNVGEVNGTHIIINQARKMFNLNRSDGIEAKRSSSPNLINITPNSVFSLPSVYLPHFSLLRPTVSCR
jgi:hypothetical protein